VEAAVPSLVDGIANNIVGPGQGLDLIEILIEGPDVRKIPAAGDVRKPLQIIASSGFRI
jgi:hypothetical protein